jgi:hypothetical protein
MQLVRISLIVPLVCGVAPSLFAADRALISYASAKPVLDQPSDVLPVELRNPSEAKWSAWSQREDKAIRARLRQGDLDSMVNLLLYGTSFTKQPRIKVENLTEASRAGTLRARVDDLIAALRSPGDNERLTFLNGLLRNQGIDPGEPGMTGVFIYNNLQRVIQEMATLAKRGEEAKRLTQPDGAPDPAAIFNWRPGLLRDRGVSLDTSIFPNFSVEQALRDLKTHGVLRDGQVARVAVIGPGLDFSDKNEAFSYDYYPQQTLQPFALYDSLLRLGLAKADAISMSIFDISSRVIDHIQRARGRARSNSRMPNIGYVIQLPRELANPWPADLIAYWRSLGDRVGVEVAPIRPPEIFQSINRGQGLETRAVRIRPDVVLTCQPLDLNIVLERVNLDEADRFDLMVGTNIFIYYDAFERSLALENAGSMLKHAGLLLTNDRLPEVPGGSMRQAGLTDVQYNRDAMGWYRRQ